ncbi:hypothetical protein [Vreelandella nigrificans]|uniref:Bacteriophage tail tape measure N-terminal domain-containing protein n=1 Tax=Vreelandella nigrificans TaxID=2042704 RepID=A0A2A4HSA6_9GAMM|nr:hypothetical protein [Halomonas nigrificans]PCF97656.1 hypothetical protein CPA45_02720 [Halomonas nigrificans]
MSARSLGRLTLDMVLQTGNFLGPMEKAQRDTERNMRRMEADAKKAGAGIAALAAGATAAAAGIYAYAKSNMDTIDANAKLARSLEGTIDGLRAVNMAASDSGIDGMEASLNRMNRRLGAVEMSGGPALKTVERLNLNLREMEGMDVDEKLAYIADRLRDSGVSSQEAARHLQQLGFEQRGATELFLKGGDAIRSARQDIEDYGLSVSMMDAAAIEEANDAIARIGLSTEAMGNAVAVKLSPALNDMADSINSVTRAFHAGDYDLQLQLLGGVAVGAAASAAAYVTYSTAVNVATIGTWAFNTAVRANPLGLAVIAIGAATGVMFAFRDELGLTSGALEDAKKEVSELTGSIEGLTQAQLENKKVPLVAGLVDARMEAARLAGEIGKLESQQRSQNIQYQGRPGPATAQLTGAAGGGGLNADLAEQQARAEAFADELQKIDQAMAELGNRRVPSDPPTTDSSAAKAAADIDKQVAALQLQAATLGMAEDELVLYKLAQEGASDSQIKAARGALNAVSAYEASEQSASDYQSLLLELRTTEEQLTDQMYERLAVLDAVNVASDEYAEAAAKIAEAAFVDAPEYGGLDATIGGPFGELDKIDEAEEKLQEWYDTQLEMLEEFRKERADLTSQWDDQERALKEQHENELARIEQARIMAQMAGAESMFGDMADITKQFAGEQSGIYKAMFAAEKAFAVASSIISIQQGIAGAAALPFPANIPAMATVAAATAGLVSNIQGTGLVGMAHDGMDYVPETGTWLLEKGEKVTTAGTSAKLDTTLDNTDAMMARVESQMNRPGDTSGGANVSFHLHEDRSRAGQREVREGPDGEQIINQWVASIFGDGKAHKALTQKYGLKTMAQ